jgi:hypothetical protein
MVKSPIGKNVEAVLLSHFARLQSILIRPDNTYRYGLAHRIYTQQSRMWQYHIITWLVIALH